MLIVNNKMISFEIGEFCSIYSIQSFRHIPTRKVGIYEHVLIVFFFNSFFKDRYGSILINSVHSMTIAFYRWANTPIGF